MRVFVTGATGAIGGHAVPSLVAAGHEVSALARTSAKTASLRAQGARPVEVSLFDRRALTDAFAGHDAVANLATAIPPMTRFMSARAWADNQRVRTEGSAAVVDAALAAGVGRLVQESVCMLYADGGSNWLDEDAPTDRFPIAGGNHAAEASARRFAEAGGAGVILRFGWFYGPGAAHSEQLLAQARHHVVMTLGAPGGYQSSIHMADAGAAVVAALEIPSGIYNVVDDEPLTKAELADALAAAAGVAPWVRGPGRAGLLFGDHLTSLTRSVRASNGRLRSASSWTPHYPSARQGWAATAREVDEGGQRAGDGAPARIGSFDKQRLIRRVLPFQNRVVNPEIVKMIERGWVPPTYALLETVGRRTGRVRRVPVANGLEGDTFWLIAGLGEGASFVKNLRANPRVRVMARPARLRDGISVRWRSGTACPLPGDDARQRHRQLGRGRPGYRLDGLFLRALDSGEMLTVRIDLD